MRKILIDVEELRECAEKGMSQLEMAVHFDTTCSAIYARMKENGIKGKAHRPSKCDRERLIHYLQQGFTTGRIAEIFDVNPTTVSLWIRRYDLKQYQKIPQKQKMIAKPVFTGNVRTQAAYVTTSAKQVIAEIEDSQKKSAQNMKETGEKEDDRSIRHQRAKTREI